MMTTTINATSTHLYVLNLDSQQAQWLPLSLVSAD